MALPGGRPGAGRFALSLGPDEGSRQGFFTRSHRSCDTLPEGDHPVHLRIMPVYFISGGRPMIINISRE